MNLQNAWHSPSVVRREKGRNKRVLDVSEGMEIGKGTKMPLILWKKMEILF